MLALIILLLIGIVQIQLRMYPSISYMLSMSQ